jgi:hypothetical protein
MSYELVGRDCTKIKCPKQGCFCLSNLSSAKKFQFPLLSMLDQKNRLSVHCNICAEKVINIKELILGQNRTCLGQAVLVYLVFKVAPFFILLE